MTTHYTKIEISRVGNSYVCKNGNVTLRFKSIAKLAKRVEQLRETYDNSDVVGDEETLAALDAEFANIEAQDVVAVEPPVVEHASTIERDLAVETPPVEETIETTTVETIEIAPIADLPKARTTLRDPRLPAAGTILTIKHGGKLHGGTWQVTVLEDGFEFEGKFHRGISGVAKAATGQNLNGYFWAGLDKPKKMAAAPADKAAKKALRKAAKGARKDLAAQAAWKAAELLRTFLQEGTILEAGDEREADAKIAAWEFVAQLEKMGQKAIGTVG